MEIAKYSGAFSFVLLLTLSWGIIAAASNSKINLTLEKESAAIITAKAKFISDRLFETRFQPKNLKNTNQFLAENASEITSNLSLATKIRSDSGERARETEIKKKIRKPVKLNMKQGLIMNQILNTYGLSEVNNTLCRDHINEFKLGLRALEPWALKMFDSSSKIMSGILGGNIIELGSYQQCLNIYEESVYGPIKGRHCTLHIRPTDDLIKIIVGYKRKISHKHFDNLKKNIFEDVKLIWSVCVPQSCNHLDVLHHFSKSIIDIGEGLNLSVSLTKDHCTTLDDQPDFTKGDYIYFCCVGLIIGIVIVSTISDIASKENTPELLSLFSIKENGRILFSTRENRDDISCLHGLRFLSMCLIVYGHRYIHNLATPAINYMDLVDWLESYYSTTVHGGTMTVDTFLLIASTLLSNGFFVMLSKGVRINLFQFYLYRHLRLIVPLALAVSTAALMTKHFGGGPIYNDLISYHKHNCGQYWYNVLLHMQWLMSPKYVCIIPTWYLGVDSFWYHCSPLLLLVLYKNRLAGLALLFSVYSFTIATNFYIAWTKRLNGQVPITPTVVFSDFFAGYYIQPLARGGPYILGLWFGYALFKTKHQNIRMSVYLKSCCWILVAICMPGNVLISRLFRLEYVEYNRLAVSLFLAFHRSIWTMCVMWVIWSCYHGHAGPVNTFLSWNLFKVWGRLVYTIFLFHYIVQAMITNSKKTSTYFSDFLTTYDSIGDVAVMSLLAIPLSLCFEYPFMRLCVYLFKDKKNNKKIGSDKDQNA
ncbi:O-acyltransferase like protein-like isoform X2 [Anthonomus grandis grandis]|uniref:O-acyltransferase like protein-like isoform X2 n=1 Tax=Anthonomus grandis grandis TaxID=2921223 RepID=UPI0021656B27|nr:O-acyltransferase like protein-like isoform X2 [Anthonomus grandis grandis]